jgi:aspartate/methionine/tyrosine aminotransferase
MDINTVPGSKIVAVSRLAFARPDVEFLCFGESDQPSPAAARDAAVAALDAGFTRYPDVRGIPALRDAIAHYLSGLHAQPVAEERIQITASGMAALSIALAATVRAGDQVVIPTPVWPNIPTAVTLRGATLTELPLDSTADGLFHLDLDRLDTALRGARALVLNSPNNPTGWTATLEELRQVLALIRRHGTWLIADEVYSRLTYDGSPAAPSLLDIAQPDDRVIVCNSFSKTFVMTGWRLGWLVLPEGTRDAVTDIVEVIHSGVAPFVQQAGIAAMQHPEAVEQFRSHCSAGRAVASHALEGMNGIRYAPPPGAFYAFVGIEGLQDSLDLSMKLVSRHRVAVAPGVAFGAAGEGFLRICFAQSPERMERAMQRLRDGIRVEMAG